MLPPCGRKLHRTFHLITFLCMKLLVKYMHSYQKPQISPFLKYSHTGFVCLELRQYLPACTVLVFNYVRPEKKLQHRRSSVKMMRLYCQT